MESTLTMVEEVRSSRQPQQTVAKYSEIVKTKIDYDHELRFSGIPEHNDAENESTERVDRSKIFEHDEKLIRSAFENLRLNSIKISSFRRLGKFELGKTRPRESLVQFCDVFTVEKYSHAPPT